MSIHNPLVVSFNVQAATVRAPFTVSSAIRPIVQAETYIFEQNQASDRWEINHNLHKFPSVTIVDTARTVVVGGVQYIDSDNIICTFSQPFSGTAYLN